jgi:hypothetical protein
VLGAILANASTQATVFLDEHFDSYANQAAFQAAWTPNAATATLATDQYVSPGQSIMGGTTATRNLLTVGEIGTMNASSDSIVFRFNFYDSDSTAAAYRQYAELDDTTAPSAGGQLFAMGLNNNIASTYYMARILGGDGGAGSGAFFKLDGAGAPTRSTGWHTLEARITDTSVSYYVDTILSKTVDITAVTDRSLDTVKVGSNLTATKVAYFDDIYVERIVVPEPGTFALVGLAGLCVVARRKLQR